MKTVLKALLAATTLASFLTTTASAGLIFDRGLPTTNLNNISGPNCLTTTLDFAEAGAASKQMTSPWQTGIVTAHGRTLVKIVSAHR